MKNILEIIENSEDVLKILHSQSKYNDYIQHSIGFSSGGTSITFLDTRTNNIIKQQKFYQQKPNSNKDFYEKYNHYVLIKESFLLESIIMQNLSRVSVIIPKIYDVLIAKDKGIWYSLIVMEKQHGIEYSEYLKNIQRLELYKCWYHFLEEMKLLYRSFRFIHADLKPQNMYVLNNQIRLIDFGLSFIYLNNRLYMRHHIVPRLLKLSKNKKPSLKTIASIDICKLLYKHNKFSKTFQNLLDTCEGTEGKRSLIKKYFPNPVIIHSPELTFDKALKELSEQIKVNEIGI